MASYDIALSSQHRLALEVLRSVLQSVHVDEPDMRRIFIGDKSILEHSDYAGLSDLILDHDMPAVTAPTVLDHYTSGTGFHGIINSQALHLAPVLRRLNEGELGPFALEHGLDGFIDAHGVQTELLKQAAADLFYTAFHSGGPNDRLWAAFGDAGNGFRLRFKVTANGFADLRNVRYQGPKTLLRQVNDALSDAGLPRFVMKGVSRVGAYFISAHWEAEQETRLLAKRFVDGCAPVVAATPYEYWPVSINMTDATAKIELLEVGVRNRDPAIIQSRLPAWCAHLPVVRDSSPSLPTP